MKKEIYMDTAASTMPSPSVVKIMNQVIDKFANPSSMHDAGIIAREIINNASNIISTKLNCFPKEINYTSGATMSNNIAIQGWMRKNPDGVLLLSSIEHNDIILLAKYLQNHGRRVIFINVDHSGKLVLDELENTITTYINNTPFLLTCQMANSETGIIQDIEQIAKIVHKYNGVLHTDATQYIPHYPINLSCRYSGVDMLSMSGQKINCIKGIGLLYIRDGVEIDPIIFGEQGYIGGTENTIGIACLGKAFEELSRTNYLYENWDSLMRKRNMLADGLSDIGLLVCDDKTQLPNNVAVIFKEIHGEDLVQLLSEHGVYISSGSACQSYEMQPSHVLKAMGYSDDDASSCVRFTIDNNISDEDIQKVISLVHIVINILKR